ncbi:winged helix-turn-helix domain-containing protein [Thermosphaera sp.]
MSNRTRIDIVEKILDYIAREEKALKTHILYASNLNSSNLNKYLDWMVKLGLVEKYENNRNIAYTITPKGIEILDKLKNLNGVLNSKRDLLSDELVFYRDVFKKTMGSQEFTVSYKSVIGRTGLTYTHLTVRYGDVEYLLLSLNDAAVSQHLIRNLAYSLFVSDDTGMPLLIILRNKIVQDVVAKLSSLNTSGRRVKTIVV